ncbi:sodium/potassium-transporting ATPase subunit alpha-like isoform X1 [Tribolium madens]|uniref:sodium/potassium-transporting ATPase subunit alpha-like isoform X1 n=1 Tax=Tribolium madens TaxID=41895 RepID=UPI001CF731D1|nr:sodium/potassium-transporting ATPase subunit alpha-like isoform X1 [Tribolium madens]
MSTLRRDKSKSKSKVRLTDEQIESFKNEYSIDDHVITLRELEIRHNTNFKRGLTEAQAHERLLRDGPNCLQAPPAKSRWLILANFLFCGFNALLWLAVFMALITFAITKSQGRPAAEEQLYFATVVLIVILFTGFFSFYQEAANVAIIEGFQKLTPKFATVIRDGERRVIPSEDVVIGDLVELKAGEWIPADVRVIKCQALKVDNSAITGESNPQSRSSELSDPLALESPNLAFFSTCAVEGSGMGVVIKRADDTLIGAIANLATSLEKGQTPIRREINYFIKFITVLAFGIGTMFFIVCLAYGYDFFTSFTYFIALIIANVPEGLPVTLTACMTLTSKRMASKNCMVKKLEAIETLGCTSVICSDKTGTLTQNKMKVVHLFYDNQAYYVMVDGESLDKETQAFQALCQVAVLCSRATFVIGQDHLPLNERETIGDASESALLKCMEMLLGNVSMKRRDNPKVCEIPFNSTNKYQVSIHQIKSEFVLLMKGAPERILDRCSTILRFDETSSLTQDIKNGIMRAINNLGLKGERVLAFADLQLPSAIYNKNYVFNVEKPNFPLTGLRFVGLISMMDPPRPAVPDAVSKCKTAGIKVIMVTGDHPITAAAIAKQVGILSQQSVTSYDIALRRDVSVSLVTDKEKSMCNAAVITGSDLREMTTTELQNNLLTYQEIVFARTSPQQKLKIVEAFQKLGHIVAVTGDGVNDSPALKKADIGIAMGIAGTDVSKEAADMILLDDNFSSIVTGVEEGRLIFDNLKKSIAYLLTSNVPEIVPFIAMVFINIPPVIGILAIMVIDVGTDLWPAISLAYEKAEADIMTRRPRDPFYDKLVNHRLILLTYAQIGVIQTCASFASYFLCMMEHGFFWGRLVGLRHDWIDKDKIVKDSYGQEWTYEERKILTRKCYSSFFLSIVLTQVADLIICKTRRLSLFQQGMTNWVLNAGIFVELSIAALAVYCPGLRMLLQFEPISLDILVPTLPFAIIIFSFDEVRKLLIRRHPGGLIDRETYY